MKVAALVISVVAVLGAWALGHHAQVAADQANEIADEALSQSRESNTIADEALEVARSAHDLEEERRWSELSPKFGIGFTPEEDLVLVHRGELDLHDVTFDMPTLVEPSRVSGILIPGASGPVRKGPLGGFGPGDERSFGVDFYPTGLDLVRLNLYCYGRLKGEERSWLVTVECKIPPRPQASYI